jgi:hypothetical protein
MQTQPQESQPSYKELLQANFKETGDRDLADILTRHQLGRKITQRDEKILKVKNFQLPEVAQKSKEEMAAISRKQTEEALKAELAKDEPEAETDREQTEESLGAKLAEDEFADSYKEAVALSKEVQEAEGTRRSEQDKLAERLNLAEIANMSLEEVRALQADPRVIISDEKCKEMFTKYDELLELKNKKDQAKKLAEMDKEEKLFMRKALRWRALETRRGELLVEEWFGPIEEEIPIEVVEAPVKKVEKKVA